MRKTIFKDSNGTFMSYVAGKDHIGYTSIIEAVEKLISRIPGADLVDKQEEIIRGTLVGYRALYDFQTGTVYIQSTSQTKIEVICSNEADGRKTAISVLEAFKQIHMRPKELLTSLKALENPRPRMPKLVREHGM